MNRILKKKEISVDGKIFILREILGKEVDSIDFNNIVEARKKQICISANLSDEEYDELTFRERLIILRAYNELNGLSDFHENSQKDKSQ